MSSCFASISLLFRAPLKTALPYACVKITKGDREYFRNFRKPKRQSSLFIRLFTNSKALQTFTSKSPVFVLSQTTKFTLLRATNFTCYNELIRYITYAVIITILTTPTQRNIRAYYRGEKCNAFFRQIPALIKAFFFRFARIPQIKN